MNYLHENIHHLSSVLSSYGVEDAILSPGSRNAPLTVALARNPHIQCHSIVDERSAGFVGLGMAKASEKPVVLCCTSGTAVLNYYPAIAESFYTGVPLIVLSADRPPELIDNWDGQCIRQEMVFDNHILSSYSMPSYSDKEDCKEEIEEILEAAIGEAIMNQGPVHINVPLREPLYSNIPENFEFKKGEFRMQTGNQISDIPTLESTKTLILLGADYKENNALEPLLEEIEQEEKAVVLKDIIANKGKDSFASYDAVLLGKNEADLQPDLLITTGKFILSKSLKTYLRKHKPKRHFHLTESDGIIGDPFSTDPEIIKGDLEENLKNISEKLEPCKAYFSFWQSHCNKNKVAQVSFFNNSDFAEFWACYHIGLSLKKETILHLANSTTVRYFSYLKEFIKTTTVQANRGTSGIDGCTSTAVGFALAEPNKNHLLITGDVAFFYDINALWNKHFPKNLKIVLLNNQGGGIFRYIDGPNKLPELEEFFETTHERTAKKVCEEYEIKYLHAGDKKELEKSLEDFHDSKNSILLEVFTDRYKNEEQFNKFKQL